MQVIKKGRPQKGWAKKFTCTGNGNGNGGCGATLLVEKDDLCHTCHTDYAGDTDWYVTFRCPECGVLTDIPDSACPYSASLLPHYRAWCDSHGIEIEVS